MSKVIRTTFTLFLFSVFLLHLAPMVSCSAYQSLTSVGDMWVDARTNFKDTWAYIYNKTYESTSNICTGKDLWSLSQGAANKQTGYVNVQYFGYLTDTGKEQAISDAYSLLCSEVDFNSAAKPYFSDWLSDVQENSGAGAMFLAALVDSSQPDYLSALSILKPLLHFLNLVAGLLMKFLAIGIVMKVVIDLSFLTLPALSATINDKLGEDATGFKALVSISARKALKYAEEHPDHGAVGWYFRLEVVEFVLLFVSMFYLSAGKIMLTIGRIMNLFSMN